MNQHPLSSPDVLTIGEAMVLMQTNNEQIQYANSFKKSIAGAESNVAIGLARLGKTAAWISRLGKDPFGLLIYKTLKGEGVDMRYVEWDEESPTGIMFKEVTGRLDPTIFYYRKESAFAKGPYNNLNHSIFNGVKLFHVSGVTLAINKQCRELVIELCRMAKADGVTISFDPNMRYKLWSAAEARPVFNEMLKLSNIVLPGLNEAKLITGEQKVDKMANKILEQGPSEVVMKLGAEGALLYKRSDDGIVKCTEETGYPVDHVVDTVGAGDGFAAGYLSAILDGLNSKKALKRANAVGALVVQHYGDWEGVPTIKEVEDFMSNKMMERR